MGRYSAERGKVSGVTDAARPVIGSVGPRGRRPARSDSHTRPASGTRDRSPTSERIIMETPVRRRRPMQRCRCWCYGRRHDRVTSAKALAGAPFGLALDPGPNGHVRLRHGPAAVGNVVVAAVASAFRASRRAVADSCLRPRGSWPLGHRSGPRSRRPPETFPVPNVLGEVMTSGRRSPDHDRRLPV